jgi:hypothetical protein
MGRTLLMAEPMGLINNKKLLVATIHLESLDNALMRKD